MRIMLSDLQRKKRFISALSVVLSVLAALLVPAVSAAATTDPPRPAANTSAAPGSSNTARAEAAARAAAAKPVDVAKSATRMTARPNPQAGHRLPATAALSPSAAKARATTPAARQARAAAAKSVIGHTAVADTCSGVIAPDIVYPCTTPSPTGTDTFTVNLTSTDDLLFFQLDSTSSGGASFVSLTPPGGTTATTCFPELASGVGQCATSGPGAYTVQVPSNGVAYTISYTPLLSDPNCVTADLSFSASPQQGTVAAGATGTCGALDLNSGDTFQYNSSSNADYGMYMTVYDATATQVCTDNSGTCTLTGTAPYRVLFSAYAPSGYTYEFQLTSLTDPTGCLAAAQQIYGTVPDASSSDACRVITVSTSGQYQVSSTNDYDYGTTLYTPDGSVACTNAGPFCQLAVGTYYFVEDTGLPATPVQFGLVFIAADESAGCTATGDTDFATGSVSGTFAGAGEELCLTLPTVSGLSDYLFDEESGGVNIPLTVVDATGAEQCDDYYQNNEACALTGTAPFHVLFSEQSIGDPAYRLLVQRTDSTAGCIAWPQSGFGGTWGATVTTVAGQANFDCLIIPSGQHSTGEMIDYADTTNTEDGEISVGDPTGKQICLILTTGICSYTPGVTYTAILNNSGQQQTYDLVRRDVSSTASCAAPASTTAGGAATVVSLTSTLDTVCYRVSGAAVDDLLFSVDTPASSSATATLQVADADGTIVCRQWGDPCEVTGSTHYQVLLTATAYAGATIVAHLDTWRVATASGWAPQCAAHQLSTAGWAPITGTLTQSAAGYCAVVSYEPNQSFAVYGTEPVEEGYPWVGMYTPADWTQGLGLCNTSSGGRNGFGCQTNGLTTAGQAVLMVTTNGAQYPADFTLEGVCQTGCSTRPGQSLVTSISPASQPAGSANQITINGSDLTLGTQVRFQSESGSAPASYATALSMNVAGTQLTVQLYSLDMAPGAYDVILDNPGYTTGTPGPGYLPNAYTVTSPPKPVTRIAGSNAIGTAIAASQQDFVGVGQQPTGSMLQAQGVVLMRSDAFYDGLAGSALAVDKQAPLLLTPTGGLDPQVLAEIKRILPKSGQIFLLGGTAALSTAVAKALTAAGYTDQLRLAGQNEYSTATAIDDEMAESAYSGAGSLPVGVMIVRGDTYYDALSAGAAAGMFSKYDGAPMAIVLSDGDELPAASLAYLTGHDSSDDPWAPPAGVPTHVYGVGGPGAAAFTSALKSGELPSWQQSPYTALVGSNAPATAVDVANEFFTPSAYDQYAAVATDATWQDALAGGAFVGSRSGPLLLTAPSGLDPSDAAYLQQNTNNLLGAYVMGGTKALPDSVENAVNTALNGD
jgi:ell wall binding domain 2 (CWB2)